MRPRRVHVDSSYAILIMRLIFIFFCGKSYTLKPIKIFVNLARRMLLTSVGCAVFAGTTDLPYPSPVFTVSPCEYGGRNETFMLQLL